MQKFITKLMFVVLLTSLSGCKNRGEGTSEVKIGNGRSTNGHSAVMQLLSPEGQCTGTWIATSVFVTAAHCMANRYDSKDCGGVTVGRRAPVRCFVNPDYSKRTPDPNDAAVLIFPLGTSRKLGVTALKEVSTRAPSVGESVTLVGYGRPNSGHKYTGTNVIREISNSMIRVGGSRTGAYVLEGDSGGPLLDKFGKLIGITQSGLTVLPSLDYFFFVSITNNNSVVNTINRAVSWAVSNRDLLKPTDPAEGGPCLITSERLDLIICNLDRRSKNIWPPKCEALDRKEKAQDPSCNK